MSEPDNDNAASDFVALISQASVVIGLLALVVVPIAWIVLTILYELLT